MGTINNLKLEICFDTGAQQSYIKEKILERLKLSSQDLDKDKIVEMADGSSIRITKQLTTDISFEQIPSTIFSTSLL